MVCAKQRRLIFIDSCNSESIVCTDHNLYLWRTEQAYKGDCSERSAGKCWGIRLRLCRKPHRQDRQNIHHILTCRYKRSAFAGDCGVRRERHFISAAMVLSIAAENIISNKMRTVRRNNRMVRCFYPFTSKLFFTSLSPLFTSVLSTDSRVTLFRAPAGSFFPSSQEGSASLQAS